ncbi:hypothetical protein [Paraburkholderia terrae]
MPKKASYAQQEDQLRASAEQAETATQQARTYNQHLRQEIATLEQNRQRLRTQVMDANARNQLALSNKQTTTLLIRQTNTELTNIRQEIANQQNTIRTATAETPANQQPSPSVQRVSASLTDLQAQARDLEQAQAQLQAIDQRRAY